MNNIIFVAVTTYKAKNCFFFQVRSRSLGVTWLGESDSSVVIQYRAADSSGWSNISLPGDMRSARVTMLTPGTTYFIRLIAVNEVGASLPSQPARATTLQEGTLKMTFTHHRLWN